MLASITELVAELSLAREIEEVEQLFLAVVVFALEPARED